MKHGCAGDRRVRRTRRGRQGRHHQGDHRAGQPARLPRRSPCRRRPTAKNRRCSCSATCSISRRPAKSSSSIAAGTTAPASNTSWDSAAKHEHQRFLELCPEVEKYIVDGGIKLIKIWLEVGQAEQEKRFAARVNDPLRQWKLSPMDVGSYARWYDYSKARDMMLAATDSKHAPWHIVHSDDKRRARLNCIAHILTAIPFENVRKPKVKLPERSNKGKYDDRATLKGRHFVAEKY